jgi:pimeloyl-ACP methyl ester carboxylesterase
MRRAVLTRAGLARAGIVTIVAAAVLATLGAGCGGGGEEAAGSASPSPSGNGSPAANVVQAAAVKHVAVGDLSVGYRVIGPLAATSGGGATSAGETPLLLIMGFSGTMDLWSPEFVAALAQGRQVIVFDNRGVGETNNPMGVYPFSQLADDTAGLIKALGYDRLDVLGWSMGGNVAIDLTVRHPGVVSQLVSYAGSAGGPRAIAPSKKVMAAVADTSGTPQQRGMRLIELLFPKGYRSAHPDYLQTFPIPKEQATAMAIGLQGRAMGEWAGVWDGIKALACPALFATGTEDVLTPPQNSVMMAARVPGAWLMRFAGAGHGLMYQDPQGFATSVLTFLDVTAPEAAAGG